MEAYQDRISQDRLNFLSLEVEEQGGAHLFEDFCTGPKLKPVPDAPEFSTHGCGKETMFAVPYDPPGPYDPSGPSGTSNFVRACANGDRMDLWPRFDGAVEFK